jgi:predicted secreted protein
MTGKDIILVLSQGGTALASTAIKSQDIQTEADVLEKASSSQQSWREYIAGRKGWSVTLSYLVLTSEKILDLLKVGQTFSVTMKKVDDNTNKVTGNAILKAVKQTASVGNLAQGSWQLQGTGALV